MTCDSPTVFFDLDGTLTDSRPGILRSIRYALDRLGVPVPDEASLLWCIGPPLKETFARLLGPDADLDRAVALYRERFGDVGLFENEVYPGIESVLETLTGRGVRLCVATSKAHVYADRIVEHFGLAVYFERVYGAELTGERVDKTDLLRYALRDLGLDSGGGEGVTMVGDRGHDMIGARNNGLSGVGVLYGYGDRAELAGAGADQIIAEVDELVGVLDR